MTEAVSVSLIDGWRDVPVGRVFIVIDAPDVQNMLWKLAKKTDYIPKVVLKERTKDRYWVPYYPDIIKIEEDW